MNVFGVSIKGRTELVFVEKDVEKALELYGSFVCQSKVDADDARLFQFRKETVKSVVDLRAFYSIDPSLEIEIKGKVEIQESVFPEVGPKMIEGRESWKREQKMKKERENG